MAESKIVCVVRWAWWWRVYVQGVLIMVQLTGRQPDYEKISYWCKRAVRVKVRRAG